MGSKRAETAGDTDSQPIAAHASIHEHSPPAPREAIDSPADGPAPPAMAQDGISAANEARSLDQGGPAVRIKIREDRNTGAESCRAEMRQVTNAARKLIQAQSGSADTSASATASEDAISNQDIDHLLSLLEQSENPLRSQHAQGSKQRTPRQGGARNLGRLARGSVLLRR